MNTSDNFQGLFLFGIMRPNNNCKASILLLGMLLALFGKFKFRD